MAHRETGFIQQAYYIALFAILLPTGYYVITWVMKVFEYVQTPILWATLLSIPLSYTKRAVRTVLVHAPPPPPDTPSITLEKKLTPFRTASMRRVDRFITSVIAVGALELMWHIPKLQMILYDLVFKLRAIAVIVLIVAAAVFLVWFLVYSIIWVCKLLCAWWTKIERTDMPMNATPWDKICFVWEFRKHFELSGVRFFLFVSFVVFHFGAIIMCVVHSLEFHHWLPAATTAFLMLFFAICYIGDVTSPYNITSPSGVTAKVEKTVKNTLEGVDGNLVRGFRLLFQPKKVPTSKAAKKATRKPSRPVLVSPKASKHRLQRLRTFARSTDLMLVNFLVSAVGWLLFFFGLAVVLFVFACIPHEFDHYSQSVVNRQNFSYEWVDDFFSSNLHSSTTQSSSLTCHYNHSTAVVSVLTELNDPRTFSLGSSVVEEEQRKPVSCQLTWETPVRHVATEATIDTMTTMTKSLTGDARGPCDAKSVQFSLSTDGASWTHMDMDHVNTTALKDTVPFTLFRLQFKASPRCKFKFHCDTKIAYQEEAYARFSAFSQSQTTPFWEKVLGITNSVARSLMEGHDKTSNQDPLVIWYRTHWGACGSAVGTASAMTCSKRLSVHARLTSSEMWHDLYSAVEQHLDVDYFKALVPELLVATKYWASIAFELTSNTVLSLIDFFVCYSVFLQVLNWMTRDVIHGKDKSGRSQSTVFAHHLKLILPFQESVVEKICGVFTDKFYGVFVILIMKALLWGICTGISYDVFNISAKLISRHRTDISNILPWLFVDNDTSSIKASFCYTIALMHFCATLVPMIVIPNSPIPPFVPTFAMLHLPTVLQLYAQCTSHNQFLFYFGFFYTLQVLVDWLVSGFVENLQRAHFGVSGRETAQIEYIMQLAVWGGWYVYGLRGIIIGPMLSIVPFAIHELLREYRTFHMQASEATPPAAPHAGAV
jgi:hypothetical protein